MFFSLNDLVFSQFLLIVGVVFAGILIIQFLINAGEKARNNDPHALGLPQGSVRAILSILLLFFFILIAIFFYLDTPKENKPELAENILTILGTLVIAVSAFYFGTKATEQGNKIAQETFEKATDYQNSQSKKDVPVHIIQEAIRNNKQAWIEQYKCEDIKIGKKKVGQTQFELACILFLVKEKISPLNVENEIPSFIPYNSKGKEYEIPTDVELNPNKSDGQKGSTIKFELLSNEEQYEIVDAYIEKNIVEFLNTYPVITGASAAKKKIGNNEIDLICLSLQVEKKHNDVNPKIPSFVIYKGYKIPTDIEQTGKSTLNFSLNPLIDGVSRNNTNDFGSIGFPVYHNNELHILSCYHVLCSIELNKGELTFKDNSQNREIVNPPFKKGFNSKTVGRVVEGKVTSFLDIAIMKPTEAMLTEIKRKGYSKSRRTLGRREEGKVFLKFLGSKSKVKKTPLLINIFSCQSIDYGTNGNIYLNGLIQMEKSSLPGDSGAAVYDVYDDLIGIIVASDDNYSYAISTYSIFNKTNYKLK